MKRVIVFWVVLSCIFLSAGHGLALETYRDIPGVTEEEISAIEALKSQRDKLTYGVTLSTEAFVLPDGSYSGFSAKFCGLMSRLFGIPFVLEMYEWDELLENLDSLSLDFTGDLTSTEERIQKYAMTSPIAERLFRIFMRLDSDICTEADVNGLKIGFFEGSTTASSIESAYPISFERVDIKNHQTAARMIEDGGIDAFVAEAIDDPAFWEYNFIRSSVFFPMLHEPVSMSTANPELAPFISVVNRYIAAGGVNELLELYKEGDFEYARYKLHRSFTSEERALMDELKQRGASVGVAYQHSDYPVVFYNRKEGEFQGIAIDVLAEISKLTDIKFEATTKNSLWSDMFEKLKTGEIRMAAQLLKSEARRGSFLWSAVPFSRSHYAIMSKEDYPNLAAYQAARATVGMVRQSGHAEMYRELFPDSGNAKEYDTLEECLDALERGEVDLLMGSEHVLLFQTNFREKTGFKINIRLNAPMDSYFGFHKDEDILVSIIDKAQQYVHTDVIGISWTGRVFDYSKKLAEERALYLMIFAGILLLILLVTLCLFIKNLKLSKKLGELASTDSLTGIFNRRCFMELGLMQIERSLRTGCSCYIMIFDLDHFKDINDRHGHLAGDKVLKAIAQRVKKSMRPYDLFGRYGGEEFIILMPDIDETNAIKAAERFRLDVCKMPVEFDGRKISISASFGVAYAAPKNDMDTAIRHADEALYRAKNEGRNRVVFYGKKTTSPQHSTV